MSAIAGKKLTNHSENVKTYFKAADTVPAGYFAGKAPYEHPTIQRDNYCRV